MENFKKLFYDLKTRAEKRRQESRIIAKLSYDVYMDTRPDVKDKTCLDIGIGSGWAMHSMLACGAKHCDGVDVSSLRLKQTDDCLKRNNYSNYALRLGDAENLSDIPSERYDYVNYLDILEHLQDYRKGIDEMRRVLKSGGLVYIKTPNNYTDCDLRLHHYGQILCSLFIPGLTSPSSAGDQRMLRDDIERLTDEEKNMLDQVLPEGFHEHMHQFYPEELYDVMTSSGFIIEKLSGTPLFSDILYNNESYLEKFSKVYVDFVRTSSYDKFVESLLQDLKSLSGMALRDGLPARYVFSDNLIVVARKH